MHAYRDDDHIRQKLMSVWKGGQPTEGLGQMQCCSAVMSNN